jgi:hypothetical protein
MGPRGPDLPFLQYMAERLGGPGSTVRDPERLTAFVGDSINEAEAMEAQEPGFFDRTIGRGLGAVGRGALGAGRFVGQNFQPFGAAPESPTGQALGQIADAADAYSATSGAVLAENVAPLARGTSYGLDPNSFDAFTAELARRRGEAGLQDILTLRPSREAFRATEFPPGVGLGLEALGDITNFLPVPGAGAAARGAARGTLEAGQAGAQAGARAARTAGEAAAAAPGATLRAGERAAEAVGQANVGNALLPPAQTARRGMAATSGEFDELQSLYAREQEIAGRLEAQELSAGKIYRHGWAAGHSNEELVRFADARGRGDELRRVGGHPDVWADMAPEDIASFRAGVFRDVRNADLPAMRQELPRIRERIRELEASRGPRGERVEIDPQTGQPVEIVELDLGATPAPSTVTRPAVQAGFGGEFGPSQAAAGATERVPMRQAELSEAGARQAERVAEGRRPAAQLPRELRGAKPRFKNKTPQFASDIDKALYIIANPTTRSRSHNKYVAWLRQHFGEDVSLISLGRDVRRRVNEIGSRATDDTFDVPAIAGRPSESTPLPTREGIPTPAEGVPLPREGERPLTRIIRPGEESTPQLPSRGAEQPPLGAEPRRIFGPRGEVLRTVVPPDPQLPHQSTLTGTRDPIPGRGGGGRLPPDDRGTMPPDGFPELPRSELAENVIGLRVPNVKPLGRVDEVYNRAVDLMGKPHLRREENVKAGFGERRRVQPVISSLANNLGARAQSMVEETFDLDSAGRLANLSGVDPSILGAPAVQDVAARLPHYLPRLSPEEAQVMQRLREAVAPYRELLEQTGVKIEGRSDIMEGGFYLPRGRAGAEGADEAIVTARKVRGGKRGFEKTATFKSQAEGIDAGFSYPSIGEALQAYVRDSGRRATDAHIARWFRNLRDESGRPVGRTAKKQPGEVRDISTRERGSISLYGLQGLTFPDEIANAAENILRREGAPAGRFSATVDVANALNNLYRSSRATLDNSALAIQGLVGLANDQRAYGKALKVNMKTWVSSDSQRIMGRFLRDFDADAAAAAMPTSQEWARDGLALLGQEAGEFSQSFVTRLPLIRRANRAFSNFGDALRLQWANDELAVALKSGKTVDGMRQSGEIAEIARIANNMTGWSEGKAFGDLGDLLLFAPRFLQSRLDTVAKAGMGLRPGATLEQRIARKSMLRMIGWATFATVAVNEALGNETDFRPMIVVDGRPRPNSNFMRIRALGRDWSLLGTWDSLARAIMLTATGKPQEALRAMGSGIVSNAWDFLSGENFVGERTRDNAVQVVKRLLENVTPFSASEAPEIASEIAGGVAEGDPRRVAQGAVAIPGEFVGTKSAPLSFTDYADPIARDRYGRPFSQLTDKQKRLVGDRVEQQNPFLSDTDTEELARAIFKRSYGDLTAAQRRTVDRIANEGKSRQERTRRGDVPEPPITGGVSIRELVGQR